LSLQLPRPADPDLARPRAAARRDAEAGRPRRLGRDDRRRVAGRPQRDRTPPAAARPARSHPRVPRRGEGGEDRLHQPGKRVCRGRPPRRPRHARPEEGTEELPAGFRLKGVTMDERSFEKRVIEQRKHMRVSPEQLLERVERSPYGPRSKEILRTAVEHESTGIVGFGLFDCPPAIVRGEGASVWDADGKEYVDMLAGFSVSNLGHGNPDVLSAIRDQSEQLVHYFDLPNEPRERLAARLAELGPGDVKRRVVFGVTGADAIELAIKLARWYTGAPTILSAYGGYHGTTGGTMATTAKGGMWGLFYPVGPHAAGHAKIPYSYPYRCPVGAPPDHCAEACVEFVARMLRGKETPFGDARAISNVAAVLLEPMQASAGYIIPGDGYLAGMRELCDDHDFLLIDDEIQAGLGRTGTLWACEHDGVVPDMIVTSK